MTIGDTCEEVEANIREAIEFHSTVSVSTAILSPEPSATWATLVRVGG